MLFQVRGFRDYFLGLGAKGRGRPSFLLFSFPMQVSSFPKEVDNEMSTLFFYENIRRL